MKRLRILIVAALSAATIAACDGLKDAFTAHVDLVARAGGQELSTERLAGLLGNSQIPVQREVAQVVADFWVSYQLVALAGAKGDSLNDDKLVAEAMWAPLAQARARKFFNEVIREKYGKADTANLEQRYAQGEALAAQHILIMMPEGGAGMSEQKQDSIRRLAENVQRRATTANFNDLVKQYTQDQGSKDRNGSYGAFAPGTMVPEFENAVRALKPGDISPVVKTNYGFHIIRRHLLSEVRTEFVQALGTTGDQKAESTYYAAIEAESKLDFKPVLVAKSKEVAKDFNSSLGDKTVLISSRRGDFTAGTLAKWLQAYGPNSSYRSYILNGPDSSVQLIVKLMMRNELLIEDAKKADIEPDSADLADAERSFHTMLLSAWYGLRVDPASLGDSARTQSEKENLAASRVEEALDRLFASNGQNFVDVPPQLGNALRKKYSHRVNAAGVDRAVERATAVRAALDSTRAREQPPGGMPPGGMPPGGGPPPTPPGGRGGQ